MTFFRNQSVNLEASYYSAGVDGFATTYRILSHGGFVKFPSARTLKALAKQTLGVSIGIFGTNGISAFLLMPAKISSRRKAAFFNAIAVRTVPA